MFIAEDRPTWGTKAAALRAAGDGARAAGKSKRAAGRRAPTPDQLLVQLAHQDGRSARVELPALCFALFGVRPAELKKGARLVVEGDRVSLIVQGEKEIGRASCVERVCQCLEISVVHVTLTKKKNEQKDVVEAVIY